MGQMCHPRFLHNNLSSDEQIVRPKPSFQIITPDEEAGNQAVETHDALCRRLQSKIAFYSVLLSN